MPNYALLKDELLNGKHERVKHVMVYVNKTFDDVIFAAELDALAKAHPERFTLINMITREADDAVAAKGAGFMKGRPSLDFIKNLVADPARTLVYACGAAITPHQRAEAELTGVAPTPRFMEGVEAIVHGLGIPEGRYKSEEYG